MVKQLSIINAIESDFLLKTLCGIGLAGEGKEDIFCFICIWKKNDVCFGKVYLKGEQRKRPHAFGWEAKKYEIIALIWSFFFFP